MHLVGINSINNQRRVWFAYVVLVLMNIVDVVYTNAILRMNAEEVNPIMNHMYQNFGIWGIIAVKAFFLALLGYVIKHLPRVNTFYRNLLYLTVVVYGLLTAYHAYWLFGLHNMASSSL